MSMTTGTHRYEIVVRNECADLLTGLIAALAIESGNGLTSVVVAVRGQSELYGLLDRFADLARRIVSLNDLRPGAPGEHK